MTVSEKRRWLILLVVSSALFLIVIDMTVLYTALPSLARDLGTSASEKLWIINAYALAVAGLPGLGTLGDRLGHKRMFVSGLIVFGIASLIAAYSGHPVDQPQRWRQGAGLPPRARPEEARLPSSGPRRTRAMPSRQAAR